MMITSSIKVSKTSPWIVAGNITTEQTALAVTGRDVATADALSNTVKIALRDPAAYAMLFRFRSDGSADDDSVLELYAARGDSDYYHRIAQLTVVQGTQDTGTSTIHFVDTVTPASEDALFDGEESNLADMIGHYYVRTLGFDKFLFLCSDLDTTTVYIDYCLLYG